MAAATPVAERWSCARFAGRCRCCCGFGPGRGRRACAQAARVEQSARVLPPSAPPLRKPGLIRVPRRAQQRGSLAMLLLLHSAGLQMGCLGKRACERSALQQLQQFALRPPCPSLCLPNGPAPSAPTHRSRSKAPNGACRTALVLLGWLIEVALLSCLLAAAAIALHNAHLSSPCLPPRPPSSAPPSPLATLHSQDPIPLGPNRRRTWREPRPALLPDAREAHGAMPLRLRRDAIAASSRWLQQFVGSKRNGAERGKGRDVRRGQGL